VLRAHGVEFNTLTCIQRHNGNHPDEVYDFLKQQGSRHLQLIPVVERGEDGTVGGCSVHPRQFGRFLTGVFERWRAQDVGRVFVQHFDLMLGIVMGSPPSLCVHAQTCGRHVVMEHDGQVFTCDHFVEPAYRLGNIRERSLAELLDSEPAIRFGEAKREHLPADCLRCRSLRFCNGGCPAHRTGRTREGRPGLNHLCEGYRLFFRHSLPVFESMATCLRDGRPAASYPEALAGSLSGAAASGRPGRNDPCPCGSGRKHKHCCGKAA
jgi:uncharacterized protein